MRFHVLGLPHTVTNKEYCGCAFTQKALTLCKMLKMKGHYVIHYSNEGSTAECDELVEIYKRDEVLQPENALHFGTFVNESNEWNRRVSLEVGKRKQPRDFLMCPYPSHIHIASDHIKDMIVVESGIGYPSGFFAPFKIFESYAIMHAYYGLIAVELGGRLEWYNRVIPNHFDKNDFIFDEYGKREDYLLFLGMRHGGASKGYTIARDAARDAGIKLLVAGPDKLPEGEPDHVEHVGLLGVKERAELLSKARALIAPSVFLEPFCGAQVEAFMSGTPVISTDWGAFVEYNIDGLTGFRCRTHKDFVEAIEDVKSLDPHEIRQYGLTFSLERVCKLYDKFAEEVMKIYDGNGGWYYLPGSPIPKE